MKATDTARTGWPAAQGSEVQPQQPPPCLALTQELGTSARNTNPIMTWTAAPVERLSLNLACVSLA